MYILVKNKSQGGEVIKARTFVSILILVLAVLIVTGSNAAAQDTVKAPIEPVYGTWVNPDYNENGYAEWAKITIRSDNSLSYCSHTDITESLNGTFNVIDSWMDSDGNKYYQMQVFDGLIGKEEFHELWRINNDNTVFETLGSAVGYSGAEYPTEMDTEHGRYYIYYRQE